MEGGFPDYRKRQAAEALVDAMEKMAGRKIEVASLKEYWEKK